jgi:putative oxidoreductase
MDSTAYTKFTWFLLRVVSGFLMFHFGAMILFGWPVNSPDGPPKFLTQTWIGGVLEFFGGIAIALGIATRPVAFVLSGMMAVAYWQFHAPQGAWPAGNSGTPSILFCFIFFFMSAYGAGAWSIDAALKRRRAAAE